MEKIVINGFFGKGNCGDEAILQTWYDILSRKYKIVASVDSIVMNKEKSDFYRNITTINNNSVVFSNDNNLKAFIIGGGGLGLGFGVKQLLHTRLRKKRNFYLGVTVHDEFFDGDSNFINLNREIFNCFEMICVRDKYSQHNLKEIFNIESMYIPDIAIGLESEEEVIKSDSHFITITIRDFGKNTNFDMLNKWIEKIENFAKINNLDIIYLPFDESDQNILKKLNKKNLYEDIFWCPKKVKYIIGKSKFCFSIGRFHPIVFALSESVTPYFIDINYKGDKYLYKNRNKSFYIMSDNNIIDNYLINDDINEISFNNIENIEYISSNLIEKSNQFKNILLETLNK